VIYFSVQSGLLRRNIQGGADAFAAIMSFVGTARKRGMSAYDAIKNALLGTPFSVLPIRAVEPGD